MTVLHFANPSGLALLAAVPALAASYRYGDRRRRAAMAAWGRAPVAQADRRRRAWKRAMQLAACAALAIALARPAMQTASAPVTVPTGDLVFLLDVSRSMLADDVRPMRLSRAREWVTQIAAQARGQRLGLVAFAGTQAVQCPLTLDHAFFEEIVNVTGPDSVARGGTKLGDAIRFAAAQAFDDVERDSKTLVVVSDGGDQENSPPAAARDAVRRGIRLVAIGIGDPARSVLVPESIDNRTPLVYLGRHVQTRLDEDTLRAIGEYVPGGTDVIDAAEVYRRLLAPARRPSRVPGARSDSAWMACLAVGILLLAAEFRVPERRLVAAAALALAVLVTPVAGFAQTVEEWFAKGVTALEEKRYADALRYFADAARWSGDKPEIRFNLGKTFYLFKSYSEAAGTFEMAANAARDVKLKARSRLGQGNALFRDAGQLYGIQAVERLKSAVVAYQQAQALDPDLFDAEFNRKVAERRLQDTLQRWLSRNRGPEAETAHAPGSDADRVLKEAGARPPAAGAATRVKDRGVERDW